ncbi:MAG: hypothetical protein JWO28_1594, partial [Hyphomicrobiales bacterium]|nr:hypothetical protein [Hyphomicrobiales bacterium]
MHAAPTFLKRLSVLFLVVFILLGAWEMVIVVYKIPPYLLPTPASVGAAFITNRATLFE